MISIKLRPRWKARVVLSGALGFSPYTSFFVWLLCLYDYDAHRRRGVADQYPQHFNDRERASPSPSACNRADSYGETQRHSPVAKEEAPAKDASPVVATAKADTKKSKHYKLKVFARQPNNYGYGNALGYAEESGYGPRGLFFR
ncbi:MAG: hypothetical protein WB689_32135 [Xanthobacteraceae bacterium]